MTTYPAGQCDIAVIGAGHAGIEAALARLDVKSFLGQISKEEFVDLLVE